MKPIARTAFAAIAIVLVVGGALAVLRPGGLNGTAATPSSASPSQSSGTPQPSPAPPSESPAASAATQTFTSKGAPPFTLDLTSEWVTQDTGDSVKLRHLAKDFTVVAAEIDYLDQIKVVGDDHVNKPAPVDLIGWLKTSPLLHPASEAVPLTLAGFPATRLDVVGSAQAKPSGGLQPDYRFTFLNTDTGDLTIVTGEPWTFFLIDGPGTADLLVSMREPTADGLTMTQEALSTLRFP